MTHHNRGILAIMIERWYVETNTRHFNIDVREMMPTIEDVWKILRLRVTGDETEDTNYGLLVQQTALYRTYLICEHICEGYLPVRVLQQCGLHQGTSDDHLQWERRKRNGKRPENWQGEP
ncbi:hypothetical protein AMTR_s00061p00190500 [Amborella trichopoda]|uniref:Aminotransferase-like plant mobile domain-containing protein n=1 Tax=Amborella trichopoda TaxID=13333 RepID=U5D9N5_AMBTC|nr:hypothetical protein AMTR_s00061p00190500 [Amborella trichopoda]